MHLFQFLKICFKIKNIVQNAYHKLYSVITFLKNYAIICFTKFIRKFLKNFK